jgi:hypothetical protein
MENLKQQQNIDLESVKRVAEKIERMLAKAALKQEEE